MAELMRFRLSIVTNPGSDNSEIRYYVNPMYLIKSEPAVIFLPLYKILPPTGPGWYRIVAEMMPDSGVPKEGSEFEVGVSLEFEGDALSPRIEFSEIDQWEEGKWTSGHFDLHVFGNPEGAKKSELALKYSGTENCGIQFTGEYYDWKSDSGFLTINSSVTAEPEPKIYSCSGFLDSDFYEFRFAMTGQDSSVEKRARAWLCEEADPEREIVLALVEASGVPAGESEPWKNVGPIRVDFEG